MPSTDPLPNQASCGEVKVTIRPSVMSWAMPRPATIRIRVATIGWMRSTATRKPFHRPHNTPTPSAAPSATGTECVSTRLAATAPAIAMTAPTDRSMPRVAITSTMPSDSSATGAPRLKTSTRLPNSRPSCRRMSKNCGETRRSASRIARKARICGVPVPGNRGGQRNRIALIFP